MTEVEADEREGESQGAIEDDAGRPAGGRGGYSTHAGGGRHGYSSGRGSRRFRLGVPGLGEAVMATYAEYTDLIDKFAGHMSRKGIYQVLDFSIGEIRMWRFMNHKLFTLVRIQDAGRTASRRSISPAAAPAAEQRALPVSCHPGREVPVWLALREHTKGRPGPVGREPSSPPGRSQLPRPGMHAVHPGHGREPRALQQADRRGDHYLLRRPATERL